MMCPLGFGPNYIEYLRFRNGVEMYEEFLGEDASK